jgi:hypothetical protein
MKGVWVDHSSRKYIRCSAYIKGVLDIHMIFETDIHGPVNGNGTSRSRKNRWNNQFIALKHRPTFITVTNPQLEGARADVEN